jgi:diaminohydroxyphosphoribosylaminopyrimidine deaminase/5-amino-6-(5-phosphoribosylamino)uracil reductase
MDTRTHQDYMQLALQLAERGRLTTSPNPVVGCVLVKDNEIIATGFHERPGGHHAEKHALLQAGDNARGATAYVTLEPCCHFGRTPPCSQALIAAGVKKVYVACLDPNPLVAGKGVAELQAEGITVEIGLAMAEARQLNEIFFHYIQHRRPFVIAKWALSLDGKTVTNPGDSRQISCPDSTAHTHQTRQQVDAILVGANTARLDNPQLTARSEQALEKQPIRIILATQGDVPADLKIFSGSLPGKTWLATTQPVTDAWRQAVADSVEVLVLPKNSDGQVNLHSLLDELGKRHITSLLVEGGMRVHESFFKANLVNRISVYLAPVFIGTQAQKIPLPNISMSRLGRDYYFSTTTQQPLPNTVSEESIYV